MRSLPSLLKRALRRCGYDLTQILRAPANRLRRPLKELKASRRLRETVRAARDPLKVIIGASGTTSPGWVPTEYPMVNIASRSSVERYFREASVRAFLAEHVWEHLSQEQARMAAANCFRMLVPGGYLRIAVPDGLHPDPAYIEYVKPGGTGVGSDDHKVLYTYRSLSSLIEEAGFEVRLLEWFDEQGCFHFHDWDPAAGFIARSTRFDERNIENPTAYTSIIADAIKPYSAG